MFRPLLIALAVLATAALARSLAHAQATMSYRVVGDAIPEPLMDFKSGGSVFTGDVGRGRAIVIDRAMGNCLICHAVPEPNERFMGDLAPDLKGVGSRLTPGQIRLRIVDQSIVTPKTIMPPYHRTDRLMRVPYRFRGWPLLTALQVEDVVAYLSSLKE
jgi:L-cysteine S-thiosulfotransferase